MKNLMNVLLVALLLSCFSGCDTNYVPEVENQTVYNPPKKIPYVKPDEPDVPTGKTIKIMPLGDSNTARCKASENGGYRGLLYQKLKTAGYDIDFVGTMSDLPELPTPAENNDPDHSGYAGYMIGPQSTGSTDGGWLYINLYHKLDDITAVDCSVILLMIGTNDFFQNQDPGYDINVDGAVRLEGLVEEIFRRKPGVTVIVASIPPTGWDLNFAPVFNTQLPDVVSRQKEAGNNCFQADLHSITWEVSDISSDQVHLSPTGYEKVADTFFRVLQNVLQEPEVE